ncbi:7TM_GPCR_Srx domain-containing protein [Caenorhabditis elegans]|uniref:7TM_GPCR_Srx domain-containing protein n=1 Tax=Caenorhabditis elegans TaxID=6239 RepID=C1P663_CAEEL|nr:7TM_GPCR_Srx domain-containing protein [Caenorhabditis elegans]CAX65082.1 7TM_GPCR_Srx domain-containing protein [Caenorhabditis elegans]|eukprot:NP_001256756.1 Uncharacterized protein CELE_Y26G10.5 [Caenorhabditis elegans]
MINGNLVVAWIANVIFLIANMEFAFLSVFVLIDLIKVVRKILKLKKIKKCSAVNNVQ